VSGDKATCEHERVETFETDHNDGLAQTWVCFDCGDRSVTWLREQAPHVVRTPHLMRVAGDSIPGESTERQLRHLQTQRELVRERERTQR